ncbi:MAG: glutathione S-transferase N-terminal domain-containing protein [Thermoleophilia bacterium]|nr:glutathione S-transferase N-terminal domain-containing protein [Thermoleophilia bacterium]
MSHPRLFHRWKCPWCAAARQAAGNVEAPVAFVEVPRNRVDRDELEAVSGQRRVPVLVDGDTVVVGSQRIVRHFYATYGDDSFTRSIAELDLEIAALETIERPILDG